MSLLSPVSSTPHHHQSFGNRFAGGALIAGAAVLLVGAGLALGAHHDPAPTSDPCGLPAGVTLADLDHHDASLIARRMLSCNDVRFGRITVDDYHAAIAALDKQWSAPPPRSQPAVVWASTVRGFSSQYSTTQWSAQQVLGPPNVWPGSGDNVNAWASLGADDRDEWIEVGFDHPGRVSGVEVYETFNPGALDRVELFTESGRVIQVQPNALPGGMLSAKREMQLTCTSEPIVAARVHIASTRVAGWNELDAIGVLPCSH